MTHLRKHLDELVSARSEIQSVKLELTPDEENASRIGSILARTIDKMVGEKKESGSVDFFPVIMSAVGQLASIDLIALLSNVRRIDGSVDDYVLVALVNGFADTDCEHLDHMDKWLEPLGTAIELALQVLALFNQNEVQEDER